MWNALKGNQGNLFEDVQQIFAQAQAQNFQGIEHDFYQTIDAGHGRIARCWTMGQVEYLIDAEQWSQFTSIAMVESVRHCEGQTSREVRYYISSLSPDAQKLAESIRSHWGIENPLHLSALNQEKTAKLGIENKRHRAGWDNDYLLKVLAE